MAVTGKMSEIELALKIAPDASIDRELEIGNAQTLLATAPTHNNKRILWLFVATGVDLFFFVIVPIVTKLPYISDPWLNVGDVWKMVDPIFTLPLFYFLLTQSRMFQLDPKLETPVLKLNLFKNIVDIYSSTLVKLLFLVGAALFIEGHGLHTASAMFKDPVKALMAKSTGDTLASLTAIYSYIRDTWEHLVSHYVYFVGILVIIISHMLAYRTDVHEPLSSRFEWSLFVIGSTLFGLIFAGVAINFPQGLTFVTLFNLIYALPWAVWLFVRFDEGQPLRRRQLFTDGKRLVLQLYLTACVLAQAIIFIYAIVFGWVDRATANIPLN